MAERTADPFSSAPVIRLGTVVSAVVAVPALVLGGVLRGGAGVTGAAIGVAVVVVFFVASKLAVGQVARRAPQLLLPAALGTYAVKIGLLGILLVALGQVDAVDLPTMAWTVFAGVFGWIGAEIWVAGHTKTPFFDPAAFAARQAALTGSASAPGQRPARPGDTAAR